MGAIFFCRVAIFNALGIIEHDVDLPAGQFMSIVTTAARRKIYTE